MKRLSAQTIEPALSGGATARRSETYKRLLASQHLQHNVLLLSANLFAALCGYLLQAILGRVMGLAAYGTFASLIALSSVMLIPMGVIGAVVAKYGASLHAEGQLAQFNDLLRRLTRILLPVACGTVVLFLASSSPVSSFLHVGSTIGVVIIGSTVALSFLTPINVGAVQGLQSFSWYASLTALPMFLRLVLATCLVCMGFGIDGAAAGIFLSTLIGYGVSFQPLRSLLAGPRSSFGSLRPVRMYSTTAMAVLTLMVVLCNADTLLAKHFLSGREAGLYAGLSVIGKVVLLLSNSIVMVMFPKFAERHRRGKPLAGAVLGAVLGVLMLATAVEAIYCAEPMLVMRILFGSPFAAVAGQLAWYGLAMLLLGVAQVFVYYFLSIDDRTCVLTLVAGGALQGLLFLLHHQTVGQLVQALVVANGMLLIALAGQFMLNVRHQRPTLT